MLTLSDILENDPDQTLKHIMASKQSGQFFNDTNSQKPRARTNSGMSCEGSERSYSAAESCNMAQEECGSRQSDFAFKMPDYSYQRQTLRKKLLHEVTLTCNALDQVPMQNSLVYYDLIFKRLKRVQCYIDGDRIDQPDMNMGQNSTLMNSMIDCNVSQLSMTRGFGFNSASSIYGGSNGTFLAQRPQSSQQQQKRYMMPSNQDNVKQADVTTSGVPMKSFISSNKENQKAANTTAHGVSIRSSFIVPAVPQRKSNSPKKSGSQKSPLLPNNSSSKYHTSEEDNGCSSTEKPTSNSNSSKTSRTSKPSTGRSSIDRFNDTLKSTSTKLNDSLRPTSKNFGESVRRSFDRISLENLSSKSSNNSTKRHSKKLDDSVRPASQKLNDSVRTPSKKLNNSVRPASKKLNDSVRPAPKKLNDSVRPSSKRLNDSIRPGSRRSINSPRLSVKKLNGFVRNSAKKNQQDTPSTSSKKLNSTISKKLNSTVSKKLDATLSRKKSDEVTAVLKSWTLFLKTSSKPSTLHLRGTLARNFKYQKSGEIHESSAVVSRISEFSVRTKDGVIYELRGPFTNSSNCVPKHISSWYLKSKSFPVRWRKMIEMWKPNKLDQDEDSSSGFSSPESKKSKKPKKSSAPAKVIEYWKETDITQSETDRSKAGDADSEISLKIVSPRKALSNIRKMKDANLINCQVTPPTAYFSSLVANSDKKSEKHERTKKPLKRLADRMLKKKRPSANIPVGLESRINVKDTQRMKQFIKDCGVKLQSISRSRNLDEMSDFSDYITETDEEYDEI